MKTIGNRAVCSAAVAALLLLPGTTGCVWAPELDRVKDELARDLPGTEFDHEFSITLGAMTIGLARLVARFIPEAGQAQDYLRDVSRVKLAVYNIRGHTSTGTVRTPNTLRQLAGRGGENAVRVRDDGDYVWIYYRIDEDEVREVYVVVLDDEQLVLVKARGHLDRLVARALADHADPDWPLARSRREAL